jgi:hypothetical protein
LLPVCFDSGDFLDSLRAMSKILALLSLLVALVALSGCSLFHKKQPRSSAHLYEGDSPTLRYTDRPETAGGAVNPY